MTPDLDRLLSEAGVVAWGVTNTTPIDSRDVRAYQEWINDGCGGEMSYLERYDAVRSDPSQLLDGACSVIVCAFPYSASTGLSPSGFTISSYALGEDYHTVLRKRLEPVTVFLKEHCGAESRVCVDTAPVRERLLAVRAGVGFIGRNSMLIVPGVGSRVFLAEIVTTASLPPSSPCQNHCLDCGECIKACPGGALSGSGRFDARRCISYLTIEYRGDTLPSGVRIGSQLYGCDICQNVCPHNSQASVAALQEFMPREEILSLSAEKIAGMTQGEFKRLTRNSAMQRIKLSQLQRNLRWLSQKDDNGE